MRQKVSKYSEQAGCWKVVKYLTKGLLFTQIFKLPNVLEMSVVSMA